MVMSRDEAMAAQAERAAERDQIQANLLELDTSFGKRLLERGSLTGTTKVRWQTVSAELASIWQTFASYAEVIRRTGEILDGTRRPSGPLLAELSELLTGPAVRLSGEQVPLARRQLTASAQPTDHVTLAAAVQRMTTSFSSITDVVSAAEQVWNEVSERLDEISTVLSPAMRQAESVADPGLSGLIGAADAELRRVRSVLTSDPLSLWHDDGVDTSGLVQLLRQAQAAATRVDEMTRLKADADRRLAEAAAKIGAATAAEEDAAKVCAEAAQKIAGNQLPAVPPTTTALTSRLTALHAIAASGSWQRLAAELEAIETESGAAAAQWQEAGRAAQALLDRRGELRGLLDAYRAKAGRQGAAENIELAAVYQRARDLLRAAPCDLPVADDAVRRYQRAVLGLSGGAQ